MVMPMKKLIVIFLFLISFLSLSKENVSTLDIEKIQILNINSSINPAVFNYLKSNFDKLSTDDKSLILIKLNTPGGLVSTTKDILTLIGEQKHPVAIWITPEGASATSAGAIIASSAHVLVMSESTNIGAATPVGLGNDIEQKDGKAKAVNDLVALIRSFADSRGRNADLYAKMISEAASYEAKEALDKKIIDGIINSEAELYPFLEGRVVRILGHDYSLRVAQSLDIVKKEMDLGQEILNFLANPSTAYILFLIGAALIYFEFQAPGGFIAGSLGALLIVIAGIGFQVLPLNVGAIALIVLAFILFILEVYIMTYGVLSIAGVVALIFGSLFLFRTENAYLDIQLPIIISTISAVVIYIIIVSFFMSRNRRNKKKNFFNHAQTSLATVFQVLGPEDDYFYYQVKISGEIWRARSKAELVIGQKCEVVSENSSKLLLEILPQTKEN